MHAWFAGNNVPRKQNNVKGAIDSSFGGLAKREQGGGVVGDVGYVRLES